MRKMTNGHASRWSNMDMRKLRMEAVSQGISQDPHTDRTDLIAALSDRLHALQGECAKKGISYDPHATIRDLEILLAQHSDGAVSIAHRQGYYRAAAFAILLGITALAVSLPHVATAIGKLMGCHIFFAYLLAVIIDLGIGGMKIIDTLSHKFNLKQYRIPVWCVMLTCLGLSALLNSYEFTANVQSAGSQILAIVLATFVPAFAFCMFYIGAGMYVKCEDKTDEEVDEISPDKIFENRAKEYRNLVKLSKGE